MRRTDRVDAPHLSQRQRLAAFATLIVIATTLGVASPAPPIAPLPPAPFRVSADLHDASSVDATLRALASRHPDDARYRVVATSLEGRPIGALEIGSRDPAAPSVFIGAGLHGREWSAHVLALNLARRLLHPDSAALAARLRVCVAPMVNPDGYAWSRTARRPQGPDRDVLWRKNRRPIGAGRLEAVGVDLNRNFDVDWADLGSPVPSSNEYRGAHAASEPEVAGLQRLVLEEPRAFALDLHSGAPYQIHAPARSDRSAPFGDELVKLALTMRAAFRKETAPARYGIGRGNRFVFEASPGGQAVNFYHRRAGAQAFTVEIGRFFDGVAARERGEIVSAWMHCILAALESVARGPGISGRVVDAATGRPVQARITIDDLAEDAIRVNRLERPQPTLGRAARFARYLVPGRYRITVTAPGFAPHEQEVELSRPADDEGGWARRDVELVSLR